MLVAGEGSFTPRGQIVPLVLPVALVIRWNELWPLLAVAGTYTRTRTLEQGN
jgi:hypothetical protein